MKKGFSLIELLVVIAIMALLIGLAVPNFLGARERARDTRRKTELAQLKTALRLYYNDYNTYPATDTGVYLKACGSAGGSRCPVCASAEFAAGGADGCGTTYMRSLPKIGTTSTYKYYQCTGGDDFRLKSTLENASDADVTASQSRCPAGCGTTYSALDYVLCAD